MKIEIELTDEQAANFLVECDRLVAGGDRHLEDGDQTLFDVLVLAKKAILEETVVLGDIVTLDKDDEQMIVRGLHGRKAWCWGPDPDGKWHPIGSYDLTRLKKFNR